MEDSLDLLRSLGPWLELLQLGHHMEKAREWCRENGAAEMYEIKENWEARGSCNGSEACFGTF